MFIDDVCMGRARQTILALFDLDRVEVIKGPQSTLFGKNTIAGDAPLGNGTFYGVSDDTGSFVAIKAPPRSFAIEATWYYR